MDVELDSELDEPCTELLDDSVFSTVPDVVMVVVVVSELLDEVSAGAWLGWDTELSEVEDVSELALDSLELVEPLLLESLELELVESLELEDELSSCIHLFWNLYLLSIPYPNVRNTIRQRIINFIAKFLIFEIKLIILNICSL